MKAAPAKMSEANALEDLGRATLRIVHDLKNQLNGLKLYATFLRKRLDRDESLAEERQTVAKLIAGLDRAARDTTALVRYAQPVEIKQQPAVDLEKILVAAAHDSSTGGSGPLNEPIKCEIEAGLAGTWDPGMLGDAFAALTYEAVNNSASKNSTAISIHAFRVSPETAAIEWRGLRTRTEPEPTRSVSGYHSAYEAFAAKVIAAHDGKLDFPPHSILVSLPLSERD
jgi:light-regulated signal transduction histidine kinase (bacteriophytochrome)